MSSYLIRLSGLAGMLGGLFFMTIVWSRLSYELYAQLSVAPLSLFLIALIGLHLLNKEAGYLGWVATFVMLVGLVLLLAHFVSSLPGGIITNFPMCINECAIFLQLFFLILQFFLVTLIGRNLLNKAGWLGEVATFVTLIGLVLLLAHFLSEFIVSVSNFETLLLGFRLLGGGLLLSGLLVPLDYGERLPPRNLLSLVTGLLALLFITLIDIPKESASWLVDITRAVGGLLGAGFVGLGASIGAAPTFGRSSSNSN